MDQQRRAQLREASSNNAEHSQRRVGEVERAGSRQEEREDNRVCDGHLDVLVYIGKRGKVVRLEKTKVGYVIGGAGIGARSLILHRDRSELCQTCSQSIKAGTELSYKRWKEL